jgi:hypothetical protein|tara:strand:- start:39592 stop:39918 length:327 start_codon:yes stop_codon:yes gene_type:complete
MINKIRTTVSKANTGLLLMAVTTSVACASTTGSGNIITSILNKFMNMMTGDVATTVGVACLAGGGLYIAATGDISKGGKKILSIIIGVGIAVMATKLLKWAGVSGALI